MILEELVDKLTKRLTAIERALREKGVLEDRDILSVLHPDLPHDIGERVRAMNNPLTLERLTSPKELKPWLIHELKNDIQQTTTSLRAIRDELTSQIEDIKSKLQALETKVVETTKEIN